ncbi:hypothetical protein FRC12_006837 [Ceratobasidium sp. 428]|nr:hypothetical protein FRC12_006837 [Ceratobasidium sp. 428]
MHSTRKVNTYGRRSKAIVAAPRLYAPSRETQWIDIPTSPLSSGSSSSVCVISPVRTRKGKSTAAPGVSENHRPSSRPGAKQKKENSVAELSLLSISSPVVKPWKRKPLVASSPKVRGSPKQRRTDKRIQPLVPVSNLVSSPLRSTRPGRQKLTQDQDKAVAISTIDACPIPGGYPPTHSTRHLSPVASSCATKTPARKRAASILILSDDSDSGILAQHLDRRPTLQPLTRQHAIIGSPPIRSRLSGGFSSSLQLGTSSRSNGGLFPPIAIPSPRPFSPEDGMPSPVDSDDEVAFLDVVAELEAKPTPAPVLSSIPNRTQSEPGPVNTARTISRSCQKKLPAKALNGSNLLNIEPSTIQPLKQKPPLKSTKSLPLAPSKPRPSIMTVEIPVSRKAKPVTQEQSIPIRPTKQQIHKRLVLEKSEDLRESCSTKHPGSAPKRKLESAPAKPAIPIQTRPEASSSTLSSRPRGSTKPPVQTQSEPHRPKTKPRPTTSSSSNSPALQSLLSTCSQSEPIDLEAFVSTFSTDDVHALYPSSSRRRWRKIGEASYSEVFGLGGVVVKVVPLRMEEAGAMIDVDGPCVSEIEDVEKEIAITRAMGEIQDRFIKLVKAHVARGSYPRELLELWDAYNKEVGSESIRPDSFSASQLYVLLILPDGGPDLEHYTFVPRTSWRTASSIFWQVAQTLAQAESLVRFEHRDLHWGQILVQNAPKSKSKSKAKTNPLVHVTLIDLGLSRMDTHTQTPWYTELEPEIFEGTGDYQFDVYRMMKAHCMGRGEGWAEYRPLTNVMWLHYLARQLLVAKGLRKPDTIASRYHTAEDVQAESRACACLVEVERMLGAAVAKVGGAGVVKAGGEVLTRALKVNSGMDMQKLRDAREVVNWGAERWINHTDGID